MILIADSGATKTDWCMTDHQSIRIQVQTSGINPFHQNSDDINQIIQEQLLPQLGEAYHTIQEIFFYGSGCTPEKSVMVTEALARTFSTAHIAATSDLMGAARALCGHESGIACILGTGSNSCLFDGEKIIMNTSPLGYILGDEGSGAVLGKRLVGDCLKHQLPDDICHAFLEEFNLTPSIILEKVYRQPLANRFLASLTPFLSKHKDIKEIKLLLSESFQAFFTRNLSTYQSKNLPVHFVGSIAFYFEEELREAAHLCGYSVGKIIKSPIEAMVQYHKP